MKYNIDRQLKKVRPRLRDPTSLYVEQGLFVRKDLSLTWNRAYLSSLCKYHERNFPIDLSSGEVDPIEVRCERYLKKYEKFNGCMRYIQGANFLSCVQPRFFPPGF